jgi:hypothetical protein
MNRTMSQNSIVDLESRRSLAELSDADLHASTKRLAQIEREILADVLKHLLEIDRRKLFSSLRYNSIYDYAIQELGYSADAAYRRIAAMRALRDIPQLEEKITSGELTLTNISIATQAIRFGPKAG